MMVLPGSAENVHTRLRIRVLLYAIISIVVLGIAILHIIRDNANVLLVGVGIVVGIAIGLIVARMFKISWDTTAAQVIGKFDAAGAVILVLYIVFEIFRSKIVSFFIPGPSAIAVSFAVLAGIMYGRVIGIRGKVRSVFREQGIEE